MLKIENLSKKFDTNKVIQDLNINIAAGEKVCLFAPSGTGKTTLIKIINGLIEDYQGSVVNEFQKISTVFQSPDLFWYKTVAENILFPFQIKKIKYTNEYTSQYKKWLDITKLKQKEYLYPAQLSGGMQQKVSLVRGFLFDPDLILLDEPFNSIDIRSRNRIIDFIKENYAQTTILFVTHTIEDIPKLAKKILLFKNNLSNYEELILKESDNYSTVIKNIYERIY